MATTIRISERTLQLLRRLKVETDSSSYDEAIEKTVIKNQRNQWEDH